MDDEQILSDAVASIIEKILMNIGITTYTQVREILEAHHITFSDCYRNPDVLNFALKELYGDAYMVVVEKIRIELGSLVDDYHYISTFMQKLGE